MFIYLATPYSDPDPAVREQRYQDAMAACRPFAHFKVAVYAPIVHWHPFAVTYNFKGDHETWWAQDQAFLDDCREAWFLQQEGSYGSAGMKNELEYCKAHRIPTRHIYHAELDQHLSLLVQNRHRYREIISRA